VAPQRPRRSDVLVHLSIHRPVAGRERDLIASMHRFGKADGEPIPGLREVHTLRDRKSGSLVGLAIWDSEEAFTAGIPRMRAAVEGDDISAWERAVPDVYLLGPV
jgi:heme-degrading monooxygenase HmoA